MYTYFVNVDILVMKGMQLFIKLQQEGQETFRYQCNFRWNARSSINSQQGAGMGIQERRAPKSMDLCLRGKYSSYNVWDQQVKMNPNKN